MASAKTKKIIIAVIGICLVLLLTAGITVAIIFGLKKNDTNNNSNFFITNFNYCIGYYT